MLRSRILLSSLLLLLGRLPSLAAPVTYNLSERHAKKQIVFESKTPLEYIEGQVTRIEGQVAMDVTQSNLGLSGSVHVPVDAMETANSQRDKHLRSSDWMNADLYPKIQFVLDPVSPSDIVKKTAQKWFVQAKGTFSMKGQSKKVVAPITLDLRKDGQIEKIYLSGRFSLRLSDFGIRGPSAVRMMGVRVSETVDIKLNLVGVADAGWSGLEKAGRPRRR